MDYTIQEYGIADPTIKADTYAFYEKFRQRKQAWMDVVSAKTNEGNFLRTTREEIDTANDLLRRLIKNLQSSI